MASTPDKKRKKRRPTRAAAHSKLLRDNRGLYQPLLELQKGGCALCGSPGKTRNLDMDHDHKKMLIRGLLCVRCNRALVDWLTPEWLRKAAEYLEHPTSERLP